MEEWFSRFFQDLQLQLGLRDPKLTAPEKNISGIFLETDTGENIDILLVGKDGRVANVQSGLPCAAQRHSHSASHDLPIFGAPASRCSPWGSRSSTTKFSGVSG